MTEKTSGQESRVTYHRENRVGFITLNRPDKRNAMTLGMWEALDQAISLAERDRGARVVIVRGAGKSFCAGLDLSTENELLPLISSPPTACQKVDFYESVRRVQEIHNRLERLVKPTICAIHGHCLGAGLEMALCCDIRLCSADTIFSLPEATLAIITDVGGLQRLPSVVGTGHAREIAYRGHRFDAERARVINLVNDLLPDKETLDRRALEIAEEIAGNPPLAVQGAKEVFLFTEAASLRESLEYNAARSSMIIPSQDLMEAMSAFLQKRKGEFKGA